MNVKAHPVLHMILLYRYQGELRRHGYMWYQKSSGNFCLRIKGVVGEEQSWHVAMWVI